MHAFYKRAPVEPAPPPSHLYTPAHLTAAQAPPLLLSTSAELRQGPVILKTPHSGTAIVFWVSLFPVSSSFRKSCSLYHRVIQACLHTMNVPG
ncbi:hypothetical protein BgiMline_030432, partial [Biomphalaria glabrata]